MLKLVFCGVLGMIPGILLVACGVQPLGFALIALGALIGILLGAPGVSLERVGLLFVAMNVDGIVPGVVDLDDWDSKDETATNTAPDFNDRLLAWLRAEDIPHRRTLWVVAGMVFGLLAGAAVALRDISVIWANQPGWLLVRGADDGFVVVLGFALAAAGALWGGATVAILGAPAYGRSVILATTFAGFCGYASGMALDNGLARTSWMFAFLGSTAAAFLALSVGFLITLELNESKGQGIK